MWRVWYWLIILTILACIIIGIVLAVVGACGVGIVGKC